MPSERKVEIIKNITCITCVLYRICDGKPFVGGWRVKPGRKGRIGKWIEPAIVFVILGLVKGIHVLEAGALCILGFASLLLGILLWLALASAASAAIQRACVKCM